eukprot:gene12072-12162_t
MLFSTDLRKLTVACVLSLAVSTSISPSANAGAPIVVATTSPASIVSVTAVGIISLVAALGFYDIVRRTTCSGDFLSLGGPGFDKAMTPAGNSLVPVNCAAPAKKP